MMHDALSKGPERDLVIILLFFNYTHIMCQGLFICLEYELITMVCEITMMYMLLAGISYLVALF